MRSAFLTREAGAVLLAAAMTAASPGAWASAAQTLGDSDPGPKTYTVLLPVSNASATATGEPICNPGSPCDDTVLTVTLPAGYVDQHPGAAVRVTVSWEDTVGGADYDLYIHRGTSPDGDGNQSSDWRSAGTSNPEQTAIAPLVDGASQYTIRVVPFTSGGETVTVTLELFNDADKDGVVDADDQCPGTPAGAAVDETGCPAAAACASGSAAATAAQRPASGPLHIDAAVLRDWARLGPAADYGAFIQFYRQGTRARQDAVLRAAGLEIAKDFRRHTSSVFVRGRVAAFKALTHPWIMRIEHNRPIEYHDATQSWTMRARVAQEAVSGGPYFDANDDTLDGKGVTLGVIDTGLFGAHPDFAGRILHNYRLVDPLEFGAGPSFVDVGSGDSDNANQGHGTHVTGIAAGGGQASSGGYPDPAVAPYIKGTFTSASPQSTIIHWGGGGTELGIFGIVLAYQHLLDNVGTESFALLRAVNGSYGDGAGAPYNAGATDKQLIRQIVGCNINMVFSAGNSGGDGSADATSSFCKDPTPGVICVASYNDQGVGNINAPLSGFSSRGHQGTPSEYPDIAAPGDLSTSTCAQFTPTQQTCTSGDDAAAETEWQPWYGTISGTSMASPNVTSVIGIIAQANPLLTPAQIESVLQLGARKVGSGYEPDPQQPGGTIHFGYGAGLVDIKTALDAMGIRKAGLRPQGEEWTIFDADADPGLFGAEDIVKLAIQEYTEAGGNHGAEYRLTLRDIAAFGASSPLTYRVEQNVNGRHYETSVSATAAGVTIPEPGPGNNAPAASAGRLGNVVFIKVPYAALGFPPVEAPIHNIAAYSANGDGVLDYAPSEAASSGATASLRAMYGRAFTVGLAVLPPGENDTVCVVPGKTRIIDDPGDQVQTPPGVDEPYDILSVHVAEPGEGPLANKVVVTIKVRGFPDGVVPSGTRWAIRFTGPNPPPAGQDDFFIMMTTEEGPAPTFVYGTTGVTTDPSGTAGARTFQIEGDLDATSSFAEDGTIQLVLDRANPLIGPLNPGDTLLHLFTAVRAPATPNNNAIYDQTGEFDHTLIDPLACVGNVAPVVDAGDDFSITEGAGVLLSGAATDANGQVLTFKWTQLAGPTVSLSNADTATATFTAPAVTGPTDLTFRLTVRDPSGTPGFDDIVVTVTDATTTPPPPPPTTTTAATVGNNSLGGALPPLSLLALGLLALLRRRSRRSVMMRISRNFGAFALCALVAVPALAVGPDRSDDELPRVAPGLDAYFADLQAGGVGKPGAAAARAIKPRELASAGLPQVDPLMNKAVFVWAGVNEPRPVVGPLTAEALIDARARDFLRRQGRAMGLTPALLETAELFEVQDLGHGPVIARYEQRLDGIEVFNRSLNVVMDRSGRPVAASGYFATGFDRNEVLANAFTRSAGSAVIAAFARMGGQLAASDLGARQQRGAYLHFAAKQPSSGTLRLTRQPRAKPVYFERAGTLEPGYYVEIAARDVATGRTPMHAYVISAVSGALLFRKDLVAYETHTYRAFADNDELKQPFDMPLGNGYTPFPGNASSDIIVRNGANTNLVTLDYGPISTGDPWLPAGATITTGNHVDACIDSTDTPASGIIVNPGNTCVAELGDLRAEENGPNTFDYPIEADGDPSTDDARNAAIVNLFYLINWLHDWWYDHGFNEAARNAQTDNYGRGGVAGDPLLAQGQDASGRNNANMGTPADGGSPTMQQYLFDGFVQGEVRVLTPVSGSPLKFSGAAFGPDNFDVTDNVVLVNDGAGVSTSDGCGVAPPDPTVPTAAAPPQATLNGNIALIDRGNCNFTTKAQFATSSGAVGMIVVQNTDGDPITMGNGDVPVNAGASPSDPAYQIPAAMIRRVDGTVIKGYLASGAVSMHMQRLPAQDTDGTLDNQIIAHEYFHYVSNRLIGNSSGLSNTQGRGMGEGWGDISSFMLSTRADDTLVAGNDKYQGVYALAGYVTNNFYAGIRRVPYTTDFTKNAFTFKHIQNGTATPDGGAGANNAEVHNAGEVWANMVWECYVGLLNIPDRGFAQQQSRMKDYLIAGMKLTPSSPTFTEARNGVLASALATDYDDFAACARGFARRGAGVYAVSPPRASTTNVGVTESYIALVGRFDLVRVEFVPSDYCDTDSQLDSGEQGVLELTFRNTGTFRPNGPVDAVVSSTDPAITFTGGGQITLPVLTPGESTTVTLGVSAGTFAATPASVPLKVAFEPIAPGDAAVEEPGELNTTFFANHDGGYRNLDDMEDSTTSPQDWTRTGSGATWSQVSTTATKGNGKVWFANDPAAVSDIQLVTPEFSVAAGGSFSMQFVHFFDFESGFDGGVIEVQVDGGGWTDATAFGASFTVGAGYNETAVAALNDRPGFSDTNSAKEAMTLSFGALLGGHRARIRFRAASDTSVAGDGWYVDDVTLNGIAEGVFRFFAAEDGVCVLPVDISAGGDFTAPEHPAGSTTFSTVNLEGSLTDPNEPPLALTYEWVQLAGPVVTLSGAGTLTPSFTAPSVSSDTQLEFRVSARSGSTELDADEVLVTIGQVNLAPLADAGADRNANEGETVELKGDGSADPDGEPLTFQWKQVAGPSVTLSGAGAANPTFTAPDLDGPTDLTFELTVRDPAGAPGVDEVTVRVNGRSEPRIGNNNVGSFPLLSLLVLGLLAVGRRRPLATRGSILNR